MQTCIGIAFTPNDFWALKKADLSNTICVVLDVLRFTSTVVTALASGATGIIPVSEIAEALELRAQDPTFLLGGERKGQRITSSLTGGAEFDLGNSPREYTPQHVQGKRIVCTTTNGTQAIRACAHASTVYIAALLNIKAVVHQLIKDRPTNLVIICSGTENEPATEDVYTAGILWEELQQHLRFDHVSDGVQIAYLTAKAIGHEPKSIIPYSKNAQRLLSIEELRDDVPFCLRRDVFQIVPRLINNEIKVH